MTVEEIAAGLVEAEAAAGFPELSRAPSSTVRRFLDYHTELDAGEAAELRRALADRGAWAIRPEPGRALPPELAPAYTRWTDAMLSPRFHAPRYQPLRLAKNMVGAGMAEQWGISAEQRAWLESAATPTAGQLRKLLKPALAERFGLAGRNQGGGDWSYERADGLVTLRLDFGDAPTSCATG